MLSVHIRKRASPLSEISREHCLDLGKRAKKCLKATRKVLAENGILLMTQ